MPSSKPPRRKGHGEVILPLSVFDRIDSLLKEQLATFPSKGELTDGEIINWHKDLSRFPIEAIDYAFDTHRRLAMFFPVYAEIIELCKTWAPAQESTHLCSEECRERHGRGYGWPDIMKLWKLCNEKVAEVGRKPNKSEWETMLAEVDRQRGQVPAWRV